MSNNFLEIPRQNLSLPDSCPSVQVVAVIYLRLPKIKEPYILNIKCRNSNQCPIKTCQYQKTTSFRN